MRQFFVLLSCTLERHYFDYGDLKLLGVEEDYDGADVVEFQCPECGQPHKSRVYGG